MKPSEKLDKTEIISIYFFANTPMYLYRNFRNMESIKELTKTIPISSLINEFDERTQKDKKSEEDIAIAYAILIAITLLEYRDALATFEKIELSKLDWGIEIKDIFIKTSPITGFLEISQKPKISTNNNIITDSNATFLSLNIGKQNYQG
jgi:hypothetical protein